MHLDRISATFPAAGRTKRFHEVVWRVVDVVVALLALVLASPVLLIVATLILLETGRPVFFVQRRLGRFGRPFDMYKFRKFYPDIGKGTNVTLRGDSRMTPLGAVLERLKLDELPQLGNIVKGDMSFVGPRPESIDLGDCFTKENIKVLQFVPGLFGPNQFYFRSESALYPPGTSPEDFYRDVLFPLKAQIDLAYFPSRTFAHDVWWIILGCLALFGLRPFRSAKFDAILSNWLIAHGAPLEKSQVS